MQNPFEALGKTEPKVTDYDEWGGMFECQHFRCRSIVDVARYHRKNKILTWECEHGHVNRIEDVLDE